MLVDTFGYWPQLYEPPVRPVFGCLNPNRFNAGFIKPYINVVSTRLQPGLALAGVKIKIIS